MTGRSRCDHCQIPLRVGDLIPVVSFLLQRGKCRHCKGTIPPDHLVIELAAGAIGGVAIAASPDLAGWGGAIFGWLLLALAALDLRHFWLPDQLTGALAATGLLGGMIGGEPDLAARLWGGVAGFVGLYVISVAYRIVRHRDGMGGGDPKLLGAIGLWLGWQALPFVVLSASLIGLIFAACQMLRGRTMRATDQVPLGALMAIAAFPVWVMQT